MTPVDASSATSPPAQGTGSVSLEVTDLVVGYGRAAPVLRGVSISVAKGEVVGVIGSNGAGKTTLVNAVCGVVPTVSGRIRFEGRDVTGTRGYQRVALGLVQVPEGRQLFPEMTVEENLRMGAYLQPRREVADDLARLNDLFPILGDRRRQLAGRMSGGEQQMVAIGRALMARPRLLMLDEPTVGLAPKMVSTVEEMIATIARSREVGVILVEQNADLALDVTERAYVMERGAVALSGASHDLRTDRRVQQSYLSV